nr:FCD domain-containing protein [Nakamurella aerolata]
MARIEDDLRAGRLAPGGRLPAERALAERYRVARSSVREAVKVLETLGMVRAQTGSGPEAGMVLISEPGTSIGTALRWHAAAGGLAVADLVAARVLVESWSAEHAARVVAETPPAPVPAGAAFGDGGDPMPTEPASAAAARERAANLLSAMDGTVDTAEFLHLDTEFHLALAQAAGNAVVAAMLQAMRHGIESYVSAAVQALPDWPAMAARLRREHRAVFDAVQAGRGASAARLMSAHINGFYADTGSVASDGVEPSRNSDVAGNRAERTVTASSAGPIGEPMRVAGIDAGTNALRLLVADVARDADGTPTVVDEIHREQRIVRLGEGVDATGRLSTQALDRTWQVLADYVAVLRASGAVRVRMAATSALRDASNGADFLAMVSSTLGQLPEVLTGEQEARLGFYGTAAALPAQWGRLLVIDIGGGSTEWVVGPAGPAALAAPLQAVSTQIGAVRITERVLRSDPPTREERADAQRWIDAECTAALTALDLTGVEQVVAVAGTALTVGAAALGHALLDPYTLHLAEVRSDRIHSAARNLLTSTRAHRAALRYVLPGRVDVIGAGGLILSRALTAVEQRTGIRAVRLSNRDLLDGLVLSLATALP